MKAGSIMRKSHLLPTLFRATARGIASIISNTGVVIMYRSVFEVILTK